MLLAGPNHIHPGDWLTLAARAELLDIASGENPFEPGTAATQERSRRPVPRSAPLSQAKGASNGCCGSETHKVLAGLSAGDIDILEGAVGLRELNRAGSGLEARTFALVKLATLIALDAPPASYAWQIANALEEGVTAEDFLGVLKAVAPQVGASRVIAAAPEIMLAMGLAIDEEGEA